jgi:hypothetical protein
VIVTPLVRAHSAEEFFKEEVEAACRRQSLHPQPLTSYYVVRLLSAFARSGSASTRALASNEALGVLLVRALDGAGSRQREELQQVGDLSLFITGFFSDSLRASLVDVDYYMSLGGHAYRSLGAAGHALSPTFAELSEKFSAFVDVLADVSDHTTLAGRHDLLRIYERWVKTGSRRDSELLVERGIVPNATVVKGARTLQ